MNPIMASADRRVPAPPAAIPTAYVGALLAGIGLCAAPTDASVVAKASATIDWSSVRIQSAVVPANVWGPSQLMGLTQAFVEWNGASREDDATFSSGHHAAAAVAELGGARALGMIHDSIIFSDAWCLGPSSTPFSGQAEATSGMSWTLDRYLSPVVTAGPILLSFTYDLGLEIKTEGPGDVASAAADITFSIAGGVTISGPPLSLVRSVGSGWDIGPIHQSGTAVFRFTLPPPGLSSMQRYFRFDLAANATTSAQSVPSAGAVATALAALLVVGSRRRSR